MFFRSCFCYILQYIANVTQRTFEIFQKNRDHANIIINYIRIDAMVMVSEQAAPGDEGGADR